MAIPIQIVSDEQVGKVLGFVEGHFGDLKGIAIKPNNLSKTISAFANASGGEVYLGIEESFLADGVRRTWNGFDSPEAANAHIQVVEKLAALGNHYSAMFLQNDTQPGYVLHITVHKSPSVLPASNGKTYIRRGAQNLPVDGDEGLQRLKFDKGISSFEDELTDVDLDDVTNSVAIIEFLLDVVPTAEPIDWLKRQRLTSKGRVSIAGVLLYSDEPQVTLPKRSAIKIYRYTTKDEEGDRDALAFDPITIEGPIYALVYDAVEKAKEVIEGIEKLGSAGLEGVTYPVEALHEIITNAILHRDYSLASDVHVRIFDDRLEVESPGKLPGHVSIDNILNEQFARNPKLVRLINKFPDPPNKDVGEGLNTTFEAMAKLRLKAPEMQEKDNSFKVVLHHQSLASPEQLVMEYLQNHDEITNSIARDLTGIKSENTMKEVFYRLRDRGQMEQVPGRKARASAWRLKRDDS